MTVVILAGGQSRRMGRDKLLLPLGGEGLLERAVRRWSEAFPRLLVSVAAPERYPGLSAEKVADVFPDCGPMAGLHAALRHSGDDVFLTAADMPFAAPAAALRLVSLCGSARACALTDAAGRWEPLFAFYRKDALGEAEALLREGRRGMSLLLERLDARAATPASLGDAWDERLLWNVNHPADYEKLRLEFGVQA